MVSRRSSARITISASRNAVLPSTVTMATARWKRSSTANGSEPSRARAVGRATMPGTRAISAVAKRVGVLGIGEPHVDRARPIRPEAGSAGSAVIASEIGQVHARFDARGGEAHRIGRRLVDRRRCGTASRAEPFASAASVTVSPTRSCSCSASWRESRTAGRSVAGAEAGADQRVAISKAAANADARTRFTGGTVRLLGKRRRPAIQRSRTIRLSTVSRSLVYDVTQGHR